MDDLAGAEGQLREREAALQEVKAMYDGAVGEKQRLTGNIFETIFYYLQNSIFRHEIYWK